MATAYFYGDFSVVYHLTNRNSSLYRAIESKDMAALKKFTERYDVAADDLSDSHKTEYEQIIREIDETYRSALESQQLPLPVNFMESFAERAFSKGNYTAANAALKNIDKLDKKVNELIVSATELLQSREVQGFSSGEGEEQDAAREKVRQAADIYYQSIRLKNPMGNQFQYLAPALYGANADAYRKFVKYVELNLLKELIEFCIDYLVDDAGISEKIKHSATTAKVRRLLLKYIAMQFSGGEERFNAFVERYVSAVNLMKGSDADDTLDKIQRTLLGRRTGEHEYYQYLRELAVEHPIGALMTSFAGTSEGTPSLAPILLKSGVSLLEFLELDK